ncbi:hypothetical protein L4174_022950 [Photobacterium sp. CCB-ST2H9]|uniref:hypothetical protein n=1 Tax=Photobacterium sp. CCB-ST2H9 TaxID=2912855 RepID=UPI002002C6A2|nr:hypothetical protein [Photobacterium sp. CCB-ST2H9]UTM59557.1 hypothetical protein L4174_022950 [Photobacterium sp. CCB-ST2H9]
MEKVTNQKGRPIKSITLALLIDLIGTSIVFIAGGFAYVYYLKNSGLKNSEVIEAINHIYPMSPFLLISIFLASFISCYAGYFCAKTSRTNEYRNVAVLALINAGLCFSLSGSYSLAHITILSVGNALVFFLGAYLWKRKASKECHNL